ncbi:hypothetical protein ACS0TY_025398 [Phlomoides rotata]
MDLSLWDPPDDHYLTSQHNNEDHSLCDFSFGYGRDVIEEDALNERSCLQVLNILVSKADEEITKLKEDILMLHCQMAWYNEALIEKTDHLNILIQNLKNGTTEDVHYPDLQLELPVEQPQSFDGSLKPLLEYPVKIKQERSEEEKECCTTMPKTDKRKSQTVQLQVESMKQGSKSPRKVQKERAYKHANAIDKNVPLVKMKRKTSEFPETGTRRSLTFKEGEESARETEMNKLEHQRQEIVTLLTNPAKSMEREMRSSSSSSTQNVNVQQTYELVGINISKNRKKEPNGASTSTSMPEKVTESSPSPQTIRKKKCCRKIPIKLEVKDYDTSSNRSIDEGRDGVGPHTNDVQKLTVVNLKAICKTLELRGYTKLNRAELIKLLGRVAPHLL